MFSVSFRFFQEGGVSSGVKTPPSRKELFFWGLRGATTLENIT
jgi:hypothetical protein